VRVKLPASTGWHCRACGHEGQWRGDEGTELRDCLMCGNREMYRKKDFPHRLGMAILTLACLASIVPYQRYMIWLVWTIMLGSLAFDVVLYHLVGDVVVCYRCDAHYRGAPLAAQVSPHDLSTAERYRQERIRLEQHQAAKKPPAV
jgi:hypothetical protein